MIRDITIGQYYPANSKIHQVDPRVKIVCTLLYLISSTEHRVLSLHFSYNCLIINILEFEIFLATFFNSARTIYRRNFS